MVGSAESLNAAASHDVMVSTSSDSEKFGWFGGAAVSSFISDRVDFWIVFSSFESERFDMSQLNVFSFEHFRNQVLSEGPSNKTPTFICLPPGLGRGTEDKRVHHEHHFGI